MICTMAKPKNKDDRHTPRIMVAIDPEIHRQIKKIAEENERPLTRQVRMILVDFLKKEGKWPLPEDRNGDN